MLRGLVRVLRGPAYVPDGGQYIIGSGAVGLHVITCCMGRNVAFIKLFSYSLMQLNNNGMTLSTGRMVVGGAGQGTQSLTIVSTTSPAEVKVTSTNSFPSILNVTSLQGPSASMMLQTQQGKKYSFANELASEKLVIKSDELEIMSLNSSSVEITGSVTAFGSLTVANDLQVGTLKINGTLQRQCDGTGQSARWQPNSHCYKLFSDKGNFQSAQHRCEAWGGYLASIKSDVKDPSTTLSSFEFPELLKE